MKKTWIDKIKNEILLKFFQQITKGWLGGVVKVDIYEVDTKIELYVDTFLLGL